ncbi:MAG: DUF4157 domain-containing protein [Bacteroidota bacterium]
MSDQKRKSLKVPKKAPKNDSNPKTEKKPVQKFKDNRPEKNQQEHIQHLADSSQKSKQINQLQEMANQNVSAVPAIQKKNNNTGLPDQLKSGVENLSGYSMDDVKVHYNSDKPAQLNAHAYAQGTDIHIASGQEKHLPHEAWHVVQQKQGRVKATKQLRSKVNINDDAALEKEADIMGARALQAKGPENEELKKQSAGGAVQRVKDAKIRPQTDQRMTDLKKVTVGILALLKELGEDWEKKYGKLAQKKASEKARSIMDREETDYPAEIRKAALRELWAQLTPEEKFQMATEAAKMGGKALSAVVSNGWEGLKGVSMPSSGSRSKKKSSSRGKEKEEDSGSSLVLPEAPKLGSLGFLSELTAEDIHDLYEIYKVRKKVLDEIAEAKSKVEESAGEIGKFFGEQAGKIRNEVDFNKRMKGQEKAFMVAKKRLELLRESIIANEDTERYEAELDALEYALNSISGPGIVYKIDLNETGRAKHPDLCQEAIGYIQGSGPIITRDSSLEDVGHRAKGFFGSLMEGSESKSQKLQTAQGQMATALETAVDKKWGKFTTWGWTPTAVKHIRKKLPRTKSAPEKLAWAKEVAAATAGEKSDNRHPETQIFYDALAKVKVDDVNSVKLATTILKQISARLS